MALKEGVSLMSYDIDYVEGEREGCSAKLTIGNRIFYVKLFESPLKSTKYYAGDQNGIFKEISKTEFELWLRILAGKASYIEDIRNKINLGKKY